MSDARTESGAEARIVETAPGRWRLSGNLGLDGVTALADQGRRLVAGVGQARDQLRDQAVSDAAEIRIDLAGVSHASSAAVALLLHWRQQVSAAGGRLQLQQVPDALARIAAFSNVDGLLGVGPVSQDDAGPMDGA
ncbi:STAS domain-containing protein [Thiohalocapsa marina]|uniref:STAS domain-containing protein n=1 Tax=Thiohalocapsa marina TaxID=424902 RepID=A0A5M8FMT1_9GAMM|nr:STAS domain-containing protein [Thiohalocapsa marina]KAA6186047.1 STAS domain-containing protein [Thiohalocapsa marina]